MRPRERRPSETIPVDLLRVVEESEEFVNSGNAAPVNITASAGADDRVGRVERINLGKGKWPDDFLDALQAQSYVPSRPITIRRASPSSLALHGDIAAPDLGLSASVNTSASAVSASTSSPRGSIESLLQASSLPLASPLAAAAAAVAARRPTHRARHSVDAPVPLVLAPRDTSGMLRHDSSPDPSSIGLGPSPGRVALRRNSTRNGQRSGTYVPRRSSPEGGGGNNSGGDGDSVPVPFPRSVSGEHGGSPSPSLLNAPSQSTQLDLAERSPSSERAASNSGNASTPSLLLPRGRFQSEVDGASSRRRPRPNSYDEFGAKPRRSRFESMVNLGVASGEQASASDLMARDATEGSMSRQTLVVREEGKAPTHFVSGPPFAWRVGV